MLTPGRIYVNSTVRIAVNFQDEDANDIDPATVSFKAYSPSGVTTTMNHGSSADLIKSSVGDYYVDFSPTESGRWNYRWQSTGSGTAIASEGTFVVQASAFFDDPARDAYRS